MANLRANRNADGKIISYLIRVYRGRGADGVQLKPFTTTFEVQPTWTEKSARKKAEAFAATYEKSIREGLISDNRQKFQKYAEYVLKLKEQRGDKHKTIMDYREMTSRIYPEIGHLKLVDIKPIHLNTLYSALLQPGQRMTPARAHPKADIKAALKRKKITQEALHSSSGLAIHTISVVSKGETVNLKTAEKIAEALGGKVEKYFDIERDNEPLSNRTVLRYHRFISIVMAQAVREGIIAINPASRAEPPKAEKHEPNYFQESDIAEIRKALETEPFKWQVLVHLLLITGARRGEVLGLKWQNVDFDGNRIYICRTIVYTKDRGTYESTPKTKSSVRYVSLPAETMKLLKQYKAFQKEEYSELGSYYVYQDFLFTQEDGSPMNPDSVTTWLSRFSKRHNIVHVNAHAFRHSMASLLYFNGMDSVSISKRLGHSQVSTTSDIYAHIIAEADKKNAEILADIFLKKA